MGLMIGVEVDQAPGEIVAKAMAKGLLLVGAGDSAIRFVPPLVVTEAEIDQAVEFFEKALSE
jgi:acetylornithine aminotransferase/acetylornithine/N-succinyldiaminopimelate aminotransferase